eukprot:14365767-Alexandrium_andersonii.AAC.1
MCTAGSGNGRAGHRREASEQLPPMLRHSTIRLELHADRFQTCRELQSGGRLASDSAVIDFRC